MVKRGMRMLCQKPEELLPPRIVVVGENVLAQSGCFGRVERTNGLGDRFASLFDDFVDIHGVGRG
jgi:hypothetical protein